MTLIIKIPSFEMKTPTTQEVCKTRAPQLPIPYRFHFTFTFNYN